MRFFKGRSAAFALGSIASIAASHGRGAAAQPPIQGQSLLGASSFADVFQKVSPAVVSIVVTARAPQSDAEADDLPFPFNQLPQFQHRHAGGDRQPPREVQAAGSGFFITADGYIVTNEHVIEGATKIVVTLADKRELPARVIGRDEATDLAVIKVEGSGFTPVAFETQIKPRVGDWVMAIGNPLQLGGTATAGIVSYVGRDLAGPKNTFVDFLQISAPITFGNSGGPSFDVYGRVVGVNSAIYSQNGSGGGGIGFAVPADTADAVTRQLKAGETIQRGYLGAVIQELDPESDAALGLPANSGAQIAELTLNGPGRKAGLKLGDIVLAIDGRKVISSGSLTRAVAQTHVGDTFELQVLRGGRELSILVRAGTRPSESELQVAQDGDTPAEPSGTATPSASIDGLDLTVSALTPALRQARSIPANVQGVLVKSVRAGSDAERKGLAAGDIVEQANQAPTASAAAFQAAIKQTRTAGRKAVFLLVRHGTRVVGLAISLDHDAPAAVPRPRRTP